MLFLSEITRFWFARKKQSKEGVQGQDSWHPKKDFPPKYFASKNINFLWISTFWVADYTKFHNLMLQNQIFFRCNISRSWKGLVLLLYINGKDEMKRELKDDWWSVATLYICLNKKNSFNCSITKYFLTVRTFTQSYSSEKVNHDKTDELWLL